MTEDEIRDLFREMREEPVPADSLALVRLRLEGCGMGNGLRRRGAGCARDSASNDDSHNDNGAGSSAHSGRSANGTALGNTADDGSAGNPTEAPADRARFSARIDSN